MYYFKKLDIYISNISFGALKPTICVHEEYTQLKTI